MELRQFEKDQEFNEAIVELLREHLTREDDRPQGVMLSGGKTPLPSYGAVAIKPLTAAPNVHIFFSDERMVPLSAPDNNANNAMPMIHGLNIPDGRVHRVQSELTLDEAAEEYHRDIQQFLDDGGHFTLGLLGLGGDGHTASLFSKEDVKRGAGKFAIPVERPEKPDRVSVTQDLLLALDRIVFLVAGPDKGEIVELFMNGPETLPAGLAVSGHPEVEVFYCKEPVMAL